EGRIHYRFHPRFGEMALLVRHHRFQGAEVFVIQQSDGTLAHIPSWMMREDSEHLELRSQPRIPLDTFRNLRIEIDTLLDLLRSDSKTGEASDEAHAARTASGLIRERRTADRLAPRSDGPDASDRDCADIEG